MNFVCPSGLGRVSCEVFVFCRLRLIFGHSGLPCPDREGVYAGRLKINFSGFLGFEVGAVYGVGLMNWRVGFI